MKKILLSAVCVLAFAATADARPIGTGQETWRTGQAPWAMSGPAGSDARDGRWERRDDRMDRMEQDRMDMKKCKKGKKGNKCRKAIKDREDAMRRDDMRDGDRWHSRDARGKRHMDLDNDGRRW